MNQFHSGREAKEFLISRIVAQANRENAPLSEIERKMLYFTETGWTLPEIWEVSEAFDREYDQNKYERKIAKLICKALKHDRNESHDLYDEWWAAIHFLKKEDHYISVMIAIAGLRPAGDQLKLFATGLAVAALLLGSIFLSLKYQIDISKYLPSRDAVRFAFWIAAVFTAIIYLVSYRFIFKQVRKNGQIDKIIEKFARVFRLH